MIRCGDGTQYGNLRSEPGLHAEPRLVMDRTDAGVHGVRANDMTLSQDSRDLVDLLRDAGDDTR